MIGVGAWLFVLTVAGFFIEYRSYLAESDVRREEREARRLERVSTSWETLLRPVGGNTGKGAALNTLLHENQSIQGADLSCNAIGGWRDGVCVNPAILTDVNLLQPAIAEAEQGADNWISQILGTSFAGNRLVALSADYIGLPGNFYDAEGLRWKIDFLEAVRPLGEEAVFGSFRCQFCFVGEGAMMWDVYLRFPHSLIRDTWVYIPEGSDIEAANVLRSQVTLDALPRFMSVALREGLPPGLSDFYFYFTYWPSEHFDAALSWNAYRTLEYCANSEDQELLNLPPPRRAIDGDNLERGIAIDISETLLEGVKYRCGLQFDEVEDLVKQRLKQWHAASEKEFFERRAQSRDRLEKSDP
jgi:hypothetical protein